MYYRIAGRGFYSCVHPAVLKDKLSIDDVDLVAWYPDLSRRDETKLHRICTASIGEFHPVSDLATVLKHADCLGSRRDVSADARESAMRWARSKGTQKGRSHSEELART